MNKKIYILLLLLLVLPFAAEAQCSMCRAVLLSQADTSAAEGINKGIIYLMVFPYILIGGIGYFIYKTRKKRKSSN